MEEEIRGVLFIPCMLRVDCVWAAWAAWTARELRASCV